MLFSSHQHQAPWLIVRDYGSQNPTFERQHTGYPYRIEIYVFKSSVHSRDWGEVCTLGDSQPSFTPIDPLALMDLTVMVINVSGSTLSKT